MPSILADGNVEGHFKVLMRVLEAPTWRELWTALEIEIVTFEHLGLAKQVADQLLWRTCQKQDVVLITGNRNAEGPESLEAVIRVENTNESLPVLTIADPTRIYTDRAYTELVAERLLEVLMDLDGLRGTGRIYVP
ncbi:MAG: ACP S-malonyltransferase [Isosphaeraceae bacterium]|jgi:Tfp pilus assembly pilus retraction ATPase PilT